MKIFLSFIKEKKKTLNYRLSAIFLILGCLFIMAGSIIVNQRYFWIFLSFLTTNPILILVNIIPIILLVSILFFSTNNAVFSVFTSGSIFALMGIINAEKIRLRQDPFYPTDLKLFKELIGIAKGFTPKSIVIYSLAIIIIVLIIILSFMLFKSKKLPKSIRISGIIITILCAVISNKTIYSNERLYESFSIDGNRYFEVNQYHSKGYIYSFFYRFNSMKVTEPILYNISQIKEFENNYSNTLEYSKEELPHIIMIMGEAYSDLSENDNLDFSSYVDPMENWKEISSNENTISGHIIVPNFGGGTSDTEFDALTALPTRFVNSASNSYSLIRKSIDAIPMRLKGIGYDTLAIHPGYAWFYNRLNVFEYMGFDNFIHLESFQGSEKYRGGYIADKYSTDSIIETFEEHTENNDSPLFQFTVTIQNHGPYDEKYIEVENTFDTDVILTDNEKTMLDSYFMGIKDADIEIKRLVDYFEESSEPVVLIYFGDHLPGFSNGMDFFDILDYDIDANGTAEQLYNVYKTPFMIWQNSSSKHFFSISEKAKEIEFPNDNTISSNYLGSTALELIGIEGLSPVLDLSNKLRKEIPVLDDKTFKLINGEYVNEIDEKLDADVNLMRQMVYYKLFDE